ncbi:hypothetical protein KDW_58510 [Dictyobacter vulcani]|uniref:Condensation domain-containing protein n=1 Tax=Dictyobacter vulcani TaxID=2607529 RepID=A0A5J4L051_9CHLR|nr:hypothetical protein KDW_58510 [Dictyobacter vulcani]
MQKTIEGYRLSPQQNYLWLSQQSDRFYAQAVVELTGSIVSEQLKAACEQIMLRHEIFRTTFVLLPGTSMPIQVLAEQALYSWNSHDLSSLSAAAQEAELALLLQQERQREFNLEQGPLVHLNYVSLGENKAALVVTFHALNADQTTLQQFVKELAQGYAGSDACSDDEEELVQYLQVSEWQNELLEEEESEAGKQYWQKRKAADLAELSLPGERKPDVEHVVSATQVRQDAVSSTLYTRLEHFAASQQSTVEHSLFSAWAILLWRLTGKSAVQVGLAVNGRIYEELAEVPGPVTRYVPLVAHLYDRQNFVDVLQVTQLSRTEAEEMQHYFAYEHANAALPYSFAAISQQPTPGGSDVSFALSTSIVYSVPGKIKLSVIENAGKLTLQWHYNTAYFAASDIERLSAQYLTLLEHAIKAPQSSIGILSLLSAAEQEQLLTTWNATARKYPVATGVARLFELQAERTPEAVAVQDQEQQLRYAEVNARLIGWRPSCVDGALARKAWLPSACHATTRCWSVSWLSSRPAPPICRWTRPIRRSVCALSSRMRRQDS